MGAHTHPTVDVETDDSPNSSEESDFNYAVVDHGDVADRYPHAQVREVVETREEAEELKEELDTGFRWIEIQSVPE